MKKIIFTAVVLSCSLYCFAGNRVSKDPIWAVPKVLFPDLFTLAMPDSADLKYSNLKSEYEVINERRILFYMVGGKRYDSVSFKNPVAYKDFILALINNKHVNFFRLYYRSNGQDIYKFVDCNTNSKPIREMVMLDRSTGKFVETKFFKTGEAFSSVELSIDNIDQVKEWQKLNIKFNKTGKYQEFYQTGKVRTTQWYIKNRLKDSTYAYFYKNGNLMSQVTTMYGRIIDTAVFFAETGKVIKRLRYADGMPVEVISDLTIKDPHKKAFLYGVANYKSQEDGGKSFFQNISSDKDLEILKKALMIGKGLAKDNIITALNFTREQTLNAFKNYLTTLKSGDKVYLHFSAQSLNDGISGIACRDAQPYDPVFGYRGYIEKAELEKFIKDVQYRVGNTGQVIVALDICYSGAYADQKKTVEMSSARGESMDILLSLSNSDDVPLFIFTGSSENEIAYEIRGDDGINYGGLSLAMATCFFNPLYNTAEDVFSKIQSFFEEKGKKQTPQLYAKFDMPLFENPASERKTLSAKIPLLRQKGNGFVISVGISKYNSLGTNLDFKNCSNDARSYAGFFQTQFTSAGETRRLTSDLLVDSQATKINILRSINTAISNSQPDDYFVFNFSGYCKPLSDSTGKQVTFFVPYGLNNISDTNEIKKEGIPLNQLKNLLQMIPANNQLFITEAGSTASFQKEFIQALIETNPTIASLTNKNRIFIVPSNSGLDNFYCGSKKVEHGPLNYYLTSLPDELNLFGLFEGGVYAGAVKYALTKNEVECDYFKTSYFDIFFEKDYLKDLEIFLPEGIALYRGGEVEQEIKKEQQDLNVKKYALVIGTDTYTANGWGNLPNALLDARRIAEELRKGFDYNVMLLENKPADSIYDAIRQLSARLNANDQLIVYVSGHGDFDDKLMDDGFMVCSDSKAKKLDPYRNTYIAYSKLSRMINRLPAKQVLMVLDVCFGGSFDERAVRNKARGDVYDDVATSTYYGEKMKLKTRLYLSSGGKVAVPDGYAGKHSPFAHRLLQALQERGGAQKMLTSSNLFEFVKKLPSGPVLGSFGDDDINTEFILVAK